MEDKPHFAYTVEPYDDGRFIVSKAQGDVGYVVEIDYDEARHRCGCKFFDYVPHDSAKRCKHIKMVLELLRKGDPDGL